jgi:hypothetical protein
MQSEGVERRKEVPRLNFSVSLPQQRSIKSKEPAACLGRRADSV